MPYCACLLENGRRVRDPFGPGYQAFAVDELAEMLRMHGAPVPANLVDDARALRRGPLPLPGLSAAAAEAIAVRLVVCELYELLCDGATLDEALVTARAGPAAAAGGGDAETRPERVFVAPKVQVVASWGRRLGFKSKRRHAAKALQALLAAPSERPWGRLSSAGDANGDSDAAATADEPTTLALLITHEMSEARFADLEGDANVGGDRHAGSPKRWALAVRVRGAAAILETLSRQEVAKRPLCGATPIKPELSFLMANLARVRRGSLVLDPFCGTGSLLMAAAALGAHTVGADTDVATLLGTGEASGDGADVGAGARANCASVDHGGALPEMVGCDVLSARSPALRLAGRGLDGKGLVDCIITDPPYGLRHPEWKSSVPSRAAAAAVAVEGRYPDGTEYGGGTKPAVPAAAGDQEEGTGEGEREAGGGGNKGGMRARTTRSNHEQLHALQLEVYSRVFALARQALVAGGRLVFLFPLKAATSDAMGLGASGRELPVFQPGGVFDKESADPEWASARAGFAFVACARQRFQNMDRYACVYEWRGEDVIEE